ncbi:MAG: hypothetical protein CVU57_22895 [Deltaproteobacteria bacterium HGW-Deltaproteobacteria-15]|nr:MAG: hypothetical protein CVU57_22895 [Deltaproteobacteria bacterium HGW-Deltaproteobacteria-15]
MKTKRTDFLMAFVLAAALAVGITTNARAEERKGVEMSKSVDITAEVVAIDHADRTLSLRGPEGNIASIKAGPEVRNFDQIEVGDKVKAVYRRSLALSLGKKGEEPEEFAGAVGGRSAEGEMPAGMAAEVVEVSAKVKAIDKKDRTVTLELPDGRDVSTEVDKSVKAFDKLKVGDMVHARYTQAVAVSLEKP